MKKNVNYLWFCAAFIALFASACAAAEPPAALADTDTTAELLDVGDPSERTGLWSPDPADHEQALANVAAVIPLDPESFITGPLSVEYGGLDGADFVEHARLTTGVLLDNGFELQYSRCWIGQEQDIVEFVFDSGNNYWVWNTWNPNNTNTGSFNLWPAAIDGVDFDPLRNTQEELNEFAASGRYPFETGADPACAPILE